MKPFEFIAPASLSEGLELLAEFRERARVVAGGTDLVVGLRAGVVKADYVVDVGEIEELRFIKEEESGVRIGAATTIAELEESPIIQRAAPALAQAASQLGAVQTRNLATIGGNLASAVPSSDMAPPLMAMDAELTIRSTAGSRKVRVESFFTGPKSTVLSPDEIITDVFLPYLGPDDRSCFVKLGRRKAMTLAIVNVAVRVTLSPQQKVVTLARIALGAVAPTPMRARGAEQWLLGKPATMEQFEAAAVRASEECEPISDFRAGADYRREMVRVLTKRALIMVAGGDGA